MQLQFAHEIADVRSGLHELQQCRAIFERQLLSLPSAVVVEQSSRKQVGNLRRKK
jgi:hypothetical protein